MKAKANDNDGWLEAPFDLSGKRIFVAGHGGMVGAALVRRLLDEPCEILTAERGALDLRRQADVERWMADKKPDVVVIAAARVGGIAANASEPADFLYDNLMIEANLVHAAHQTGVEKLLFLGSSCIYPKDTPQPISENALLSGPLEPTNAAYAVAKIAGLELCAAYRAQYGCDFISAMPCNLYGPGDRYDAHRSHVIPALMMKAHEAAHRRAETLEIWGSGEALREFLHVEDLADALVFLLKRYSGVRPVNVGSGEEISIRALAQMIAEIAGFRGDLAFDTGKPDGVMRKLLDSRRINAAGWLPSVPLREGLPATYLEFSATQQSQAV